MQKGDLLDIFRSNLQSITISLVPYCINHISAIIWSILYGLYDKADKLWAIDMGHMLLLTISAESIFNIMPLIFAKFKF